MEVFRALLQRLSWRLGVILAGCIVAFYFMNLIFDIRVRELRSSLKNLNNNQTSFRTLALISRYQLIRDRMTKSDEANQFKHEGKTMLALSQSGGQDESERVTVPDRAGIVLINGLNWITGSEPLRNYYTSTDQRALELAYLYELKRDYARAVEAYDLAIKLTPTRNQDAILYAYLHRGFCLSLLDKKNEALADYSIVISSNQTGEFRYTAEILSAMLRDLLDRSTKIDQMADSEGKAEAYYKLAAYPKALAVYEKLQRNGALSARATYYAGRTHEELGQSDKAAEKFRLLIASNAGAEDGWAMRANRRIYALGAFYGGDRKFREESQKNAQTIIQDKELLKAAEKFESVVKQTEEKAKVREEEIAETQALVQREQKSLEDKPVPLPMAANVTEAAKPAPEPQKPIPAPAPPAVAAKTARAEPPVTVPAAPPVPPAEPKALSPEEKLQSALKRDNLTRAERKSLLMNFREIEMITLIDENTLWGIPIAEDAERVSFFTVMGKVNLARNRIKARDKVGSEEAFR